MRSLAFLKPLETLILTLLIIGGVNWGSIGLFQIDLIASLFGGTYTPLSRFVYSLVGLAALLEIVILWSSRPETAHSVKVSTTQVDRKPRHIHTT